MGDRIDAKLVSQTTIEYRVYVLPLSVIWEKLLRDSFALSNSEGSMFLFLHVTETCISVVTLSPGNIIIVLNIMVSMHVYLLQRNHCYLSRYK